MQIVEGEYYKTRDGRKAGPVRPSDNLNNSPYQADLSDGSNWNYDANGKLTNFRSEQPEDLVASWVDTGPIRTETVTTRRIEPGVYGRLQVAGLNRFSYGTDKQADVGFVCRGDTGGSTTTHCLTASELRELARVATELAEFMDAQ